MTENVETGKANAYKSENKSGLKKGFKLHDAIMFGITAAVGSGILFGAAGASLYAGPGELISWILAVVMISFLTVPYAEYASMFPRVGISSRIGFYSFGSYGGFLTGWGLFLWTVLIPPIEAVAVATYASYYVPSLYNSSLGVLTPQGVVLAIILALGFVGLNIFGVRIYGKFNDVLTWLKVGSLVAIAIFVASTMFHPSNFSNFLPYGTQGIFIAIPAAGILFSFGGYRQVADMSAEIENPKKNAPKAILTVLAVQSIFYIIFAVLILGAVNWKGIGTTAGNWGAVAALGSPMANLISSNLHKGTSIYVIGGGMVVLALLFAIYSPMGTFGSDLVGASRIIHGFSKERALPKLFQKVSKRGTPMNSLILVAILSVVFIVPYPSWYTLVDFVVVAAVINFAMAAVSLSITRKLYPDVERSFRVPAASAWSFVAFIFAGLLIYWATYPVTLYALGAVLAGSFVYIFQAVQYRRMGKPLHLRSSMWIPFYIVGMIILSYIGGKYSGGINLIPYPWDMITVIVYSAVFWFIAQAFAPKEPILGINELVSLQEETA